MKAEPHLGPMPVYGSRRQRARERQEAGEDAGPCRQAKPENMLLLEIVCAPDGWPSHGEQVVIRRSRSLTDDPLPPYDETVPRNRVTPHQLRSETGQAAKDEGTCPKCGAHPQLSAKKIEQMLDVMEAQAGGKSLTRRWDFRKQRLLPQISTTTPARSVTVILGGQFEPSWQEGVFRTPQVVVDAHIQVRRKSATQRAAPSWRP